MGTVTKRQNTGAEEAHPPARHVCHSRDRLSRNHAAERAQLHGINRWGEATPQRSARAYGGPTGQSLRASYQ
eukprot:6865839-Prorocentrum_lima.AAC.1